MDCTNPNGCTLDSGEMVERVNAWRDVSSKAISRKVESTKIRSEYPPEPLLLQQLKDLIAAEAVCCSFLKFDLCEERDRTVVELEFPEDARALVESVLALPNRATSTR
jgi:hypothetical protein